MPKKPTKTDENIERQLIGRKDLATLLGVTPNRISQLAKEGAIVPVDGHNYNMVAAVLGYIKFRTENADIKAEYWRAKTERERMRADDESGRVCDAARVREVWTDACAVTRQRLMAIPARVSGALVGIDDPAKIFARLSEECRTAMEDLATSGARASKHE